MTANIGFGNSVHHLGGPASGSAVNSVAIALSTSQMSQ
jgi:hypothetical protein